jgi:iron complex transport system substrate-binding protein
MNGAARGGLRAGALGALIAALVGVTAAHAADTAARAKPQRIVSLNLCTDVLLADLVPRDRIAAVSFLGPDPQVSAAAKHLAGWPTIRGEAEEVLALDADLVLTIKGARPQTVDLLRRLGRHVVTIPPASDFSGIRSAITAIAQAVGTPEKGAGVIARFDATLARAAAISAATGDAADRRPTAVAVQVGNLVSGQGSLVDEALAAAGFDNIAASRPLGAGGRLPLEALVARPPDLVVLANDPAEFRTAAGDNLRHPAFRALLLQSAHVLLPLPAWVCGSPAIADAVVTLAEARARLVARGRQ